MISKKRDMSGNVDETEISKFEAVASRWWDRNGAFGALHDINDTRVGYIESRAGIRGRRVLDVGCGGGILSEAMARRGADVTGIDGGQAPLAVAASHMRLSGLAIDYRQSTAEAFAEKVPGEFDVVTCLELLEHVPDPDSVVRACRRLARPGGHLFFATLNRTPLAYLLAIVAAEYLMGLVPRGTHRYDRFIRPSELAGWAVRSGLTTANLSGLHYIPFIRRTFLGGHCWVNYMAHFIRDH